MAELTQSEIETKITTIDTEIDEIVTALSSDTGAVAYVDYTMGGKSVSASQKLEQLMKIREMYQTLLNKFPKEITRVHAYDIDRDGSDQSDLEGDQ